MSVEIKCRMQSAELRKKNAKSLFDDKLRFSGELFFVHFFPPAERNEPKKRRIGNRGS